MKVIKLPAEELRVFLLGNREVAYRREQARSDLPNQKEYSEGWLAGYKYGVETVLSSFQPNEAQARLDAVKEIKEGLNDYEIKLSYELAEAKHRASYFKRDKD